MNIYHGNNQKTFIYFWGWRLSIAFSKMSARISTLLREGQGWWEILLNIYACKKEKGKNCIILDRKSLSR